MRQARTLVAVLGTGSIGMRHLGVLQSLPGVEAVAVPVRVERAEALGAAGVPVAADLAAAAARGARCAIVATDTGRHHADVRTALELGMAVLVEKPMAATAREAEAMRAQARALGRPLFVACVLRFAAALNTFRDWLPRLGRVHAVRIACQSYLPDWRPERDYRATYAARAEEGGVLRDLIHEVDYAGWLYGWPRAVGARLRNLGRLGIAAEECADLQWETDAGASMSLTLDYLTRPAQRHMQACGEHGSLRWDGITRRVELALAGAPLEIAESTEPREAMYVTQARAFLRAVDGDLDPRLATAEDGLRAVAVCDAARMSSEANLAQNVEYP